mmetsp:Transcript_60462/g.112943  ORF Transcript_60462/g.112943 Transcript_60462/m.112943 type:complete len:107 (-) Transcript_60462:414-734(-)
MNLCFWKQDEQWVFSRARLQLGSQAVGIESHVECLAELQYRCPALGMRIGLLKLSLRRGTPLGSGGLQLSKPHSSSLGRSLPPQWHPTIPESIPLIRLAHARSITS